MIEIKVILTPEVHALLKAAQEGVGVARQDIAVGAYLQAELLHNTSPHVSQQMFVGLPRMMEILQAEASEQAAVKQSKKKVVNKKKKVAKKKAAKKVAKKKGVKKPSRKAPA